MQARQLDLTPQDLIRRCLADGTVELPSLPKVAHEVMIAAQDPERGALEVARLVERDPLLCARVLRSANSALFGARTEIVSARQAVTRIGMTDVAALAMTAAVHGALLEGGTFGVALGGWWRGSLSSALFAKEIARARRQAVDSAFLCGLLRRVGAAVVLRVLGRAAVEIDARELDRVVNAFETEAGLLICDAWQLSAPVRSVIAYCNDDGEPADHAAQVHTVRLATELAAALAENRPDTAERLQTMPAAIALNLYAEDLQRLVAHGSTIATAVEELS
ncbi:MAG: HDOD domain-containing protein [Deltaproteobacteria bacterium]|nr:HDOD domain-containing protein [Nannocystaceae bacterium]